jgi:hypothetical protein
MLSHVDYFQIGRVDEIRKYGWAKVYLMGWEVMILPTEHGFVAIELGEIAGRSRSFSTGSWSFLPDNASFSRTGVKSLVEKFLLGPTGTVWGGLRHFPVRIENDFLLVGVIR